MIESLVGAEVTDVLFISDGWESQDEIGNARHYSGSSIDGYLLAIGFCLVLGMEEEGGECRVL